MKKWFLIPVLLITMLLIVPYLIGLNDAKRKAPELAKGRARVAAAQTYASEMKAQSESANPSLRELELIKERYEKRVAAIEQNQ